MEGLKLHTVYALKHKLTSKVTSKGDTCFPSHAAGTTCNYISSIEHGGTRTFSNMWRRSEKSSDGWPKRLLAKFPYHCHMH